MKNLLICRSSGTNRTGKDPGTLMPGSFISMRYSLYNILLISDYAAAFVFAMKLRTRWRSAGLESLSSISGIIIPV